MPALGHLSQAAHNGIFNGATVNPSTPNICWPNTHLVWQAPSLCPLALRRGHTMFQRCLPSWPAGQMSGPKMALAQGAAAGGRDWDLGGGAGRGMPTHGGLL